MPPTGFTRMRDCLASSGCAALSSGHFLCCYVKFMAAEISRRVESVEANTSLDAEVALLAVFRPKSMCGRLREPLANR